MSKRPGKSDELLASGAYARKQLFCQDRIIAWSHRSRFEMALRLAAPFAGKRLLDYGCGDGSFLALARELFPDAVGADIDRKQVLSCRERFSAFPRLSFLTSEELRQPGRDGEFEVIVCTEVLEHCTESQRKGLLAALQRLSAPAGVLILSVPIETGPSLLVKEALRAVAGWRKLGHYEFKEHYSPAELAKMVFATSGTRIDRPIYQAEYEAGVKSPYHGHKGFNWRELRATLSGWFRIERTEFTPVGLTRGLLDSQAWFVCRKAP